MSSFSGKDRAAWAAWAAKAPEHALRFFLESVEPDDLDEMGAEQLQFQDIHGRRVTVEIFAAPQDDGDDPPASSLDPDIQED